MNDFSSLITSHNNYVKYLGKGGDGSDSAHAVFILQEIEHAKLLSIHNSLEDPDQRDRLGFFHHE